MPIYDKLMLLNDPADKIDGFAANTNSTYVVNFGITSPNLGKTQKLGVHIVIMQAYTDVNSGGDFIVMHGSSTAPATRLITRRLTRAQMNVAGAHYYIPLPPNHLQYIRMKTVAVSETSTLGYHAAWIGPDSDGTI